jgi:hypothetical protein
MSGNINDTMQATAATNTYNDPPITTGTAATFGLYTCKNGHESAGTLVCEGYDRYICKACWFIWCLSMGWEAAQK